MKSIVFKLLLLAVIFIISFESDAQYYTRSRKNFSFLIGNQSSFQGKNNFNPSLELGTLRNMFYLHGGAGRYTQDISITQNSGRENETLTSNKTVNNHYLLTGVDLHFYTLGLMDLSNRAICRELLANFIIGFDVMKDVRGPVNSSFGYRAKFLTSFFVIRSGSAKRDIGTSRHLQFGYSYNKFGFNDGTSVPTHNFLVNFIFMKHKLKKFADWF
jgi:hypothetical protein